MKRHLYLIAILIQGETGTGKEFVARAIHQASARSHRPFLTVTCARLWESLQDAELFDIRRVPLLALCKPDADYLMLRVIETSEFRRVGGTTNLNVDARVISGTNRDLNSEVKNGGHEAAKVLGISHITLYPKLKECKINLITSDRLQNSSFDI
jgi:DNA-binding NtrC family response regulator